MNKPILSLFLVLSIGSCNTSPTTSGDEPPRSPNGLEKRLTEASSSFGLSLFRTVSTAGPGENQFISPLSVSLALSMSLNGASGGTHDSMKAALALDGLSEEEINRSFQSLMELLLRTDPTVRMEIANSVWYRSGFTVEQTFFEALTHWFDAEVKGLDFSSPAASPTINQWVSDATGGKITEIVPALIPAETVMYLINALYFKGSWSTRFDPSETRPLPFTRIDGSSVEASFMILNDRLIAGFPDDGTVLLELPYGDGYYRMVFLLPSPGTGVDAFVAGLTDEAWRSYLATASEHELTIRVPKFRMQFERSLKNDLTSLGMGLAFTEQADFTRINRQGQLFISEVRHKTFVQVDEEGTEAAAVTSVEISLTSAPQVISFDRPFVFAIRDVNTGAIVFIGKMHEPT